MSQDIGKLPKPEEVQSLMQAFTGRRTEPRSET